MKFNIIAKVAILIATVSNQKVLSSPIESQKVFVKYSSEDADSFDISDTTLVIRKIGCDPESGKCSALFACNDTIHFRYAQKIFEGIWPSSEYSEPTYFPLTSCYPNEVFEYSFDCSGKSCISIHEVLPDTIVPYYDSLVEKAEYGPKISLRKLKRDSSDFSFSFIIPGKSLTNYYSPKILCSFANSKNEIFSRDIFALDGTNMNLLKEGKEYKITMLSVKFIENYNASKMTKCSIFDYNENFTSP